MRDDRPIPNPPQGAYTRIILKLPFGWERDETEADRLIIRMPDGEPIPGAVCEALREVLGEFTEMGIAKLYQLNQLKALSDSIIL